MPQPIRTAGPATATGRAGICLIRPPAVESFRFATTTITLPLGLAYVAGVVEESGRPLAVVDAVALAPRRKTRYFKGVLVGLPLEQIVERIPADCATVGISIIFTHEWPAAVRLVQLIKAARPELTVIMGGEHISSAPEFCLATSEADVLVLGEGEETILELLDVLDAGGELGEVPGLAWRDGDSIRINARRKRRRDVDSIPYPAWHLFDVKTYNDHHFVGGQDTRRVNLPLLATRGCPYQCTFCSSPNMWSPVWIPRDPVKVVDEIEHHVKHFGAGSFPFQDLTAIIQKDWTITFCKEILRRGLDITWQFPSGTRCEVIDAEVADLMKRTQMVHISYAPESGSESTRQIIKKKMSTENLMNSIRASADAGLNVAVFLIIGFPHDSDESVAENLAFVREIRRLGVTDLGIGYFFALPGTELFDSLYGIGRVKLDRDYFAHILQGADIMPTVSHSAKLGRWDLLRWKLRLYYTFYSTPLQNRPRTGFLSSAWRALSGLVADRHDSKLQTVIRVAAVSGWDVMRLAFSRGWMARRDERELFSTWDDTFRAIRRRLTDEEIFEAPAADTTTLHRANVMVRLKRLHETARSLPGLR
jgi:anaerobic magnesium-protoporphyrin IX monomethyl ester cyclase